MPFNKPFLLIAATLAATAVPASAKHPVVGGAPIGYFYADRDVTAPEGISPEETALIKMIKGQVIARITAR